ncbi:hypothetical protein [Pseudomonas putida]|uniref:hypothetical protein n=1 Tax=Pseudomonas putida TaxID=303 RepID=UPI00300E6E25
MQELKGIHLALIDSNAEESNSSAWFTLAKVLSANDCCYDNLLYHDNAVPCGAEQSRLFMPFSQAIAPGIWKIIATWLAADERRKLRVTIGRVELEANALVDLIALLNRALAIYLRLEGPLEVG